MCRPVISLILPPNVVGFVSVGPTAPCVALWEDFSSIGLELVRGGPAITGAAESVVAEGTSEKGGSYLEVAPAGLFCLER